MQQTSARRWTTFPKASLLFTAGLLFLTFGRCDFARASLPVGWDIRLGPSFTGVTGELADSLDRAQNGSDLGIALRWPGTASSLAIQAEFLWARRARSFQDMVSSGLGAGIRFRRSLLVDYMQIPLLARVSLRRTGTFRPYTLVGPYVAWRLSSHFNQGVYVGDEPVNPRDVRKTDAGAIIGLGSGIVIKKGEIAAELRVGLGAVDVLEKRAGVAGAYRVLTLLVAFTPSP